MKNLLFVGGLLTILAGCSQDIQPENTPNSSNRVANGATITGTLQINKSATDSTHCQPSTCNIVATKIDINQIVKRDSTGITYSDTLWKETNTKLKVVSNINQPFKLTDVVAGYYKLVLTTTPCGFSQTIDRVKVADGANVNLGSIHF
ncbi:hypothetical protein EXU85_34550 [Spirosoma sp. KCTC 42546]|uniref:hypothetical protein n=1 Tax=Spirosoma sp. KCTC 42546 TaxID=2520506 RepID=UPI001158A7F5|nr:hypothetical protein [Spirosoma sp. KCTC 42546]QDK83455.1 hypothetical protein EXU85_34550 [Spirosoma sp. KCTC 42546]